MQTRPGGARASFVSVFEFDCGTDRQRRGLQSSVGCLAMLIAKILQPLLKGFSPTSKRYLSLFPHRNTTVFSFYQLLPKTTNFCS